jgi:hypothetical protein
MLVAVEVIKRDSYVSCSGINKFYISLNSILTLLRIKMSNKYFLLM